MSSVPAYVPASLPALGRLSRRRRGWLVAVVVSALAIGGALTAYLITARQHAAHQAALNVEIAGARARVVKAAQAKGIPVSAKAVAATQAAAAALKKPSRVADAPLAAELFASHSWYVPPPPPPPPAYEPPPPPPPPMAPPLPYVFLGSYTPSGDVTVFFLTRGDRVYDVKVGDTLDGIYHVESASDGQLIFNYKPLDQRQSMSIGATP